MGILEDVPAEELNGASSPAAAAMEPAVADDASSRPVALGTPSVVGAGSVRSLDPMFNASAQDWGSVGRNDPCPCGSGKKFKKCHGATA